MSGFNFQGLNGIMLTILLGLIGLGILALFIRFNKVLELLIGIGASIFWMVYLVVDFNRIVSQYHEATASAALQIAMKIYADLINLFVQLLPIIVQILVALGKKK